MKPKRTKQLGKPSPAKKKRVGVPVVAPLEVPRPALGKLAFNAGTVPVKLPLPALSAADIAAIVKKGASYRWHPDTLTMGRVHTRLNGKMVTALDFLEVASFLLGAVRCQREGHEAAEVYPCPACESWALETLHFTLSP